MSTVSLQHHHEYHPRTSFSQPASKRMRTQTHPFIQQNTLQPNVASRKSYLPLPQFPAANMPRYPSMNQVPPMPLYQQNLVGTRVASRTSYPSVPEFPKGNSPGVPSPWFNQVPLMPSDQNAARLSIASRPSYLPSPQRPQFVMQRNVNATTVTGFSQISANQTTLGLVSNPHILQQSQKQQYSSVGLEFDPAKLKVRHESVIRSLYADLPRQCTSCGMRFKTKEEHSEHMDWHVRKNRDAKKYNQKKRMVSRKYFLTSKLWLCAAEAIGSSTGPAFKVEEENKSEKPSCDVVADECQKECPLCLEPFDEYFSNDANDWMYREAIRFNPMKIPKRMLFRSLIGRIVHVKCISGEEI